ncbi:MAG: hypothetical protein QNJ63_28305 [Calothrix sp. MO_192.B10]|nr:hypothetical protein [Calothrix sp. MO_192.B10]
MLIEPVKKNKPPSIITQGITDNYTDNKSAGKTIGSKSPSGITRKGVDVEKLIAIDNGALRIQPMVAAGWGRQGIAYGPYTRTNGLAFAVLLVNCHNTSQSERIESIKERLHRWLIGSETEKPLDRFWQWLKSPQKRWTARQFWWWIRTAPEFSQYFHVPNLDENLAIGWFPQEVPENPLSQGNGFIIHATGAENGEVWTRVGENMLSAFKGLKNLQTYYIVVLREKGAAYYAASVPNACGLGAYPNMRPIAIDAFNDDPQVYAALYQSVLGQIGFRIDTRVYGTQVAEIPALTTWYGTAQAADSLTGDGKVDDVTAERGGQWQVWQGCYQRTAQGTIATQADSVAVLDCGSTSGLIHLVVETPTKANDVSLLWRVGDENNYWSFEASSDRCRLRIRENGQWETLAVSNVWFLQPNAINSLQILDEGKTFSLYLNGKLVFNKRFVDSRLHTETAIGIAATQPNSNLYFQALEAHPPVVSIPQELDLGSPWEAKGTKVVIVDNFVSPIQDLAGTTTNIGEKVWRREMGMGAIALTGHNSVKVQASRKYPNPGRTAYTLPWDNPNFADLEVDITPPGTSRGQRERGRGGLIFWQDADNYITVNNWLDDCYGGASISSFFYLNGFEELYDAVWTNVGSGVRWGVTHNLRMIFDGMNYMVYVNNEPVLYRALTDVYPDAVKLTINRVGIVANWEWGNDTGSTFKNFVARV